jgi:hypothetical protein
MRANLNLSALQSNRRPGRPQAADDGTGNNKDSAAGAEDRANRRHKTTKEAGNTTNRSLNCSALKSPSLAWCRRTTPPHRSRGGGACSCATHELRCAAGLPQLAACRAHDGQQRPSSCTKSALLPWCLPSRVVAPSPLSLSWEVCAADNASTWTPRLLRLAARPNEADAKGWPQWECWSTDCYRRVRSFQAGENRRGDLDSTTLNMANTVHLPNVTDLWSSFYGTSTLSHEALKCKWSVLGN